MKNHKKMPPAISLDLETWGRSAGCAIRSIGATVFEPDTGMLLDDHFYCNITDESCRKLGLHFDPDTVEFWERQSDEAKAPLALDQVTITYALNQFSVWYCQMLCKYFATGSNDPMGLIDIWGNGDVFDVGILGYAYSRSLANGDLIIRDGEDHRSDTPWEFWNPRDMRTIVALGQHLGINIKRDLKFHGTPHYALDDAKHQAKVIGVTQATIIARAYNPPMIIGPDVRSYGRGENTKEYAVQAAIVDMVAGIRTTIQSEDEEHG